MVGGCYIGWGMFGDVGDVGGRIGIGWGWVEGCWGWVGVRELSIFKTFV